MRIQIFLLFIFSLQFVYGQNNTEGLESLSQRSKLKSYFKVLPKVSEDTPDWAKLLYEDPSNFIEIQKLKEAYFKSNAFKKNIHTQNYKHWFKIVHKHINENGIVQMPNPGEVFLQEQQVPQ